MLRERLMSLKNRQNMAEEIATYLSEKIIRMELTPGERILEAKIAEELAVSRSPVREALRILEKYQLIELIPRRGGRVKEMTPEYIRCLFEVMSELLGLITRLCCKNRTDTHLVQLVRIEEKALTCAQEQNARGYIENIYDYVLLTLQAGNNPVLAQMINDYIPGLRRAYFLSLTNRSYNLCENAKKFREIHQHIVDGQTEIAEQKVKAYALLEQDRVMQSLSI